MSPLLIVMAQGEGSNPCSKVADDYTERQSDSLWGFSQVYSRLVCAMVSRQRGRVSEHLAHSTGQEVFLFSEYCGLWTGTGTAEVSSHKACPCAVCCRMEAWSWNSNRILEVLWKTLAGFVQNDEANVWEENDIRRELGKTHEKKSVAVRERTHCKVFLWVPPAHVRLARKAAWWCR